MLVQFLSEYLESIEIEKGLSSNTIEAYGRDIESFIENYSTEMSKDPVKHLAYANVLKTNASAVLRQTPYEIAQKVSENLYAQNKLIKGRYYGWIMGDFMCEDICSEIWQTNYFIFDE